MFTTYLSVYKYLNCKNWKYQQQLDAIEDLIIRVMHKNEHLKDDLCDLLVENFKKFNNKFLEDIRNHITILEKEKEVLQCYITGRINKENPFHILMKPKYCNICCRTLAFGKFVILDCNINHNMCHLCFVKLRSKMENNNKAYKCTPITCPFCKAIIIFIKLPELIPNENALALKSFCVNDIRVYTIDKLYNKLPALKQFLAKEVLRFIKKRDIWFSRNETLKLNKIQQALKMKINYKKARPIKRISVKYIFENVDDAQFNTTLSNNDFASITDISTHLIMKEYKMKNLNIMLDNKKQKLPAKAFMQDENEDDDEDFNFNQQEDELLPPLPTTTIRPSSASSSSSSAAVWDNRTEIIYPPDADRLLTDEHRNEILSVLSAFLGARSSVRVQVL